MRPRPRRKPKPADRYTGPAWVGPLFKYLGIGALALHIITNVMDWEPEWECNEKL